MAGYHFVKNHTETPDIGTFINWRAVRLLGRHITNGSEYGPKIRRSKCHRSCPVRRSRPLRRSGCEGWIGEDGFGKLRDPKVEHFYVAVRTQHDVLRFDVAMDNSRVVSGGERTRHLDDDIDSFTQLHRSTSQAITQRL